MTKYLLYNDNITLFKKLLNLEKIHFEEEKYVPDSEIYFQLEKIDDTHYKIIDTNFPDYLIVKLKEAYPSCYTNKEGKLVYPTYEDWSYLIGREFCIGGILELCIYDDVFPKRLFECDFESLKPYWCLISYEAIDAMYEFVKDYYNSEKILESMPLSITEISIYPEIQKEFKKSIETTYLQFKRKEMLLNAFHYFLSHSKRTYDYNSKFDLDLINSWSF
jgi:hypothetical protein